MTSIIIIVNIGHGQNSNTKKNNNNKRSPTIDLYERKNNNSNVDKTITTTTTKSYAAKNFVVIFIQQIEMIAHLMILISYFSMLLGVCVCVCGIQRVVEALGLPTRSIQLTKYPHFIQHSSFICSIS